MIVGHGAAPPGPARAVRQVGALVLAAGASHRLGSPKQLLRDTHGDALLVRLTAAALHVGCTPIIVVLGANAPAVRALLRDAPHADALTLVENSEWASGMASSIRCGLEAMERSPATAALLLACDQPAVNRDHFEALLRLHARTDARAVSRYDDVAGIPAVWPRADWPAMRALAGDRGARSLLQGDEAAVDLPGGALDLDTPADLARWRASGTESDPSH